MDRPAIALRWEIMVELSSQLTSLKGSNLRVELASFMTVIL